MSRVQLFGIGTQSASRAITAAKRINCYVEPRKEMDRTVFALIGRPGLVPFVTTLGAQPSRALWPVNSLSTPLLFTVNNNTLYSIDNTGVTAVIGTIATTSGDISMADDGTYLLEVDGTNGYTYNMVTPAGLNQVTSATFTTTPKTVTWQDNYFIVTAGSGRQFQLSQISPSVNPQIWPSVQINFAGTGAGSLQAGMTDHNVLNLFGPDYTEYWQDSGGPDFPFSKIPGASQEFGLAAPFSLAKFDNSVIGLFNNRQGGANVSRLSGTVLQKVSDQDMDTIFTGYLQTSSVSDAQGISFMFNGHPMYLISFPTAATSWVYDGLSNAWSEWQATDGTRFWGNKFANFIRGLVVSDYRSGNIYKFSTTTYDDNGSTIPMEVISKHIWEDDKYLGIDRLQVDIEAGVGLVSGQGVDPVMDLLVSKDGGFTFASVGYSSMGRIGEYTQRVMWRSLGAARDWVLKLRITDPVKRVLTGASAEITGGSF